MSNPIPFPNSSNRLEKLIAEAPHIPDMDKSFLLAKLPEMKPLDKLQLEQSLLSGMIPESLAQIARLRQKFMATENKPKGDVITKIVETILPQQPKVPASQSILIKPHLSGMEPVQAVVPNPAPAMIRNLTEFATLDQLAVLNPAHVTFAVNDPVEQIMENFFEKVVKLFETVPEPKKKRAYLMTFMQSMLFNIYLNTGITALRHPELQPRSIALNQMSQIDNRKYLNKKQFQYTAQITSYLRSICGL
ncbi:MAG: hypothetical protein OHK0017_04750 [Patescibacteria group bacterium]